MRALLLLSSTVILSGCFTGAQDYKAPTQPQAWNTYEAAIQDQVQIQDLSGWWKKFNDPALNALIDMTLQGSPDRKIAQSRILEARGMKRTNRAILFPQIGASASAGREDSTVSDTDDFHDARFDASFELDIFGVNRKTLSASNAQIEALTASYNDVTLTLIADVARSYIQYRGFAKQVAIAQKNVEIQTKTLKLIKQQRKYGEAPQLDVERSENLVNTTKSSIPEFQRLADNARLRLSVLTGALPEQIMPIIEEPADIPGASVVPVLIAPSKVLSLRPDVRAASANLMANTKLSEAAVASLFPTFTLSGFYGVAENALVNSTSIWNVAIGTAVNLIDFGRIEGRIDAARAREAISYEQYRKTVLFAVSEVETALNDYARINERRAALQKAFDSADRALSLSQTLFREGEVSFLDVLDSQRTVNAADSALIEAEAAQAESLIRLHKSLGLY